MYRFETVDLGTYRGTGYFLVGFVDPEPNPDSPYHPDRDADDYGVSLARETTNPFESHVQVVRLDTSHGRPHLDKLYLSEDTDESRKVWLDHGYTYARMKRYVLTNWRTFADRYRRHREP